MLPEKEMRTCERYAVQKPVRFTRVQPQNQYSAEILNVSDKGMFLKTSTELPPGEELLITLADCSTAPHLPRLCKGYTARVMFCKKHKESGIGGFGIGVAFSGRVSPEMPVADQTPPHTRITYPLRDEKSPNPRRAQPENDALHREYVRLCYDDSPCGYM